MGDNRKEQDDLAYYNAVGEGNIKLHPKRVDRGSVYGHNVVKRRAPVNNATEFHGRQRKGHSLRQASSTFHVVWTTSAKLGLHAGNKKFNTENE